MSAPVAVSAATRAATARLVGSAVPPQSGAQVSSSATTKARLYVSGEPTESVSAAVVALTYGV